VQRCVLHGSEEREQVGTLAGWDDSD